VYQAVLFAGEKSPKGVTDPNFWRKAPVFFQKKESPDFAQFSILLVKVSPQGCQ
jgi:hypothetical protein